MTCTSLITTFLVYLVCLFCLVCLSLFIISHHLNRRPSEVVQKTIDQCPGNKTPRWVHGHACWLVDYEDVLILEQAALIQAQVLWRITQRCSHRFA
jgi:hypothetical protein